MMRKVVPRITKLQVFDYHLWILEDCSASYTTPIGKFARRAMELIRFVEEQHRLRVLTKWTPTHRRSSRFFVFGRCRLYRANFVHIFRLASNSAHCQKLPLFSSPTSASPHHPSALRRLPSRRRLRCDPRPEKIRHRAQSRVRHQGYSYRSPR